MFFQLFLAIGLVHGALSCCAPLRFECNTGFTEGYSSDTSKGGIGGFQHTWFDAIRKRAAVNQTVSVNGVSTNAFIVLDYNTRKQYVVMNGKCQVQNLTSPSNRCIPSSAKSLGLSYIGLKYKGLLVENFSILQGSIASTVSVTKGLCLPVGGVSAGKQNGVGFLLTYGSTDYTMGISDRTKLDIPTICNQETYHKEEELTPHLKALKGVTYL